MTLFSICHTVGGCFRFEKKYRVSHDFRDDSVVGSPEIGIVSFVVDEKRDGVTIAPTFSPNVDGRTVQLDPDPVEAVGRIDPILFGFVSALDALAEGRVLRDESPIWPTGGSMRISDEFYADLMRPDG